METKAVSNMPFDIQAIHKPLNLDKEKEQRLEALKVATRERIEMPLSDDWQIKADKIMQEFYKELSDQYYIKKAQMGQGQIIDISI